MKQDLKTETFEWVRFIHNYYTFSVFNLNILVMRAKKFLLVPRRRTEILANMGMKACRQSFRNNVCDIRLPLMKSLTVGENDLLRNRRGELILCLFVVALLR